MKNRKALKRPLFVFVEGIWKGGKEEEEGNFGLKINSVKEKENVNRLQNEVYLLTAHGREREG